MKETIDSVIKMNEKAKIIVEEARQKAEEIVRDANEKAEVILNEGIESAKQKAAENEKKTAQKIAARNEQNAIASQQQQTEFLEKVKDGEENWVNEIYNKVISGGKNAQ